MNAPSEIFKAFDNPSLYEVDMLLREGMQMTT